MFASCLGLVVTDALEGVEMQVSAALLHVRNVVETLDEMGTMVGVGEQDSIVPLRTQIVWNERKNEWMNQ